MLRNSPIRALLSLKYRATFVTTNLVTRFLEHPYSRLCRYDRPIGAMLLYWPVVWGLALAAPAGPSLSMLSMFFMGAWTSRSAGCIINDLFDKQFDKYVQRTKNRPLASGEVSNTEAALLLLANLCGGLFVLTKLPKEALIATFCILPIAALYPLAKRYTKYPQLVLGVAFNSGVIIGGLSLGFEHFSCQTHLPLYVTGIIWTLIYDTIYAFQDIKDDKKLGLKSTAITWEADHKFKLNFLVLLSFLSSMILPWLKVQYIFAVPGFFFAHIHLYYEIGKVDFRNGSSCAQFFRKANHFGFFIFLSLLMSYYGNMIYERYLGEQNNSQVVDNSQNLKASQQLEQSNIQ